MNKYSFKNFLGVDIDTDFTLPASVSDLFTDNGFSHLYIASNFNLDSAIFSSITRELATESFFFFNDNDYTDEEAKDVLRTIFFNNYKKALNKFPYLNDLLTQKTSLLSSFGVSTNSMTTTTVDTDARDSISKINETPQSGNIDVSADTYLSSVSRNTTTQTSDYSSVNLNSSTTENKALLEFLNEKINTQCELFTKILLNNLESI